MRTFGLQTRQADSQWQSQRLKGFVNSGGNEGAATLSGDQSMIIFYCLRQGVRLWLMRLVLSEGHWPASN